MLRFSREHLPGNAAARSLIGCRSGSNFGIGILRGILPELGEDIYLFQRRFADEKELIPKPVEPRLFASFSTSLAS